MNKHYERMRANQLAQSPVSWLDRLRVVRDAEQSSPQVKALRPTGRPHPSLYYYPDSKPPLSAEAWEQYMTETLARLFVLEEDLACHNVTLTEEEHSTLLHCIEGLRAVLRGEAR